MRPRAALPALFAPLIVAGASAGREPLTVLWTGETHAMLLPCECPYRPEGGLARRATAVKNERERGAVVLLDAGGWAAGGLYDEYTEGRDIDMLRTTAAVNAMLAMGYDALALSDEELAYGPGPEFMRPELPAVSANLYSAETGERLAEPFRIAQVGGWKVGVVGLSPRRLDLVDAKVALLFRVTDPVAAARGAIAAARRAGANVIVLLSPLGEEMSERLARELEGIDLVVSAGRRTTPGRHFRAGGTLVVQFDFQGRSLGRARLVETGGGPVGSTTLSGRRGVRAEPLRSVRLSPRVPDDPVVARIVEEELERIAHRLSARRLLTIELFKMALCPYSPKVERTLAEVARAIPGRVALRATQIVRVDARGELQSLHGRSEVEEARRQAAIFAFYPSKYWDYAAWRAKNPMPRRVTSVEGPDATRDTDWEGACRRLQIGVARVKGAVATGESDAMLRRGAYRAERLGVTGSPTLYLGGRKYGGRAGRLEILRAVCRALPGGSEGVSICRGLPACFSDADCRKPGFVVECLKPATLQAKCVHHKAVKVEAVVVEDSRAVYSPVDRILDSLRVFFPGLDERRVDYVSPEGTEVVARYEITRLPAYIIDKAALKERHIDPIREALVPQGDRLVLAPMLAGSHEDITRPREPGRVDLFLAPHSRAAAEALEVVDEVLGDVPGVSLRSAVRRDAEGKLRAPGGIAEIEAMLREIAVSELHPGRFRDYLRARSEGTGSSYWRDPLVKVGLDPDEIRREAEGGRTLALLDADAQELAELGAEGPVTLLVANQELVPVSRPAELRHALDGARSASTTAAHGPSSRDRDRRLRAVPLLVRALEAVPEAARERIARGLRALTGEDFRADVGRWKAYLRESAGAR